MPSRRTIREKLELEELIEEQAYEDKFGRRCQPEGGNTTSLDALMDEGVQIDQDGSVMLAYTISVNRRGLKRTHSRLHPPRPGSQCIKHDPSQRRRTPKGHAYCNACQVMANAKWSAKTGGQTQ